MSDEIPTPRTDAEEAKALAFYNEQREAGWPPFEPDSFSFARGLEKELAFLQQKVRELQAAAVPDTHRTCTECHRLLPAALFPKLHGNESICGECYFSCGGSKL